MQGTVGTFDSASGSGTLLLDDGSEVAIPAAAFAASGLRLLRPGQRLTVEADDEGRVTRVHLPGID
jgi:2-phospho-L-lactate guanylyltransferase